MSYIDDTGVTRDISAVEPGRLIGDLAIILDEPRDMNLIATEDSKFLRIGAEQFRSVIETDPKVLMSLLQTVAGHLTGVAGLLREARIDIRREAKEASSKEP